MQIWMTTTQTQTDPRLLDGGPDLGASFGVKLLYWRSGSMLIPATAGKQFAILGQAAAQMKADGCLIDRETSIDSDQQLAAIVPAVRAQSLGITPAYTNEAYFGIPAGMTAWAYMDPTAAEQAAIYAAAQAHAPWVKAAGAALIRGQFMRPTDARACRRLIQRQADAIRVAAPEARRLLFMQDTWNWSAMEFPPMGAEMCRRLMECCEEFDLDLCVFQPFMIDASYPWRPFWDVLGEFLVCVDDRERPAA